MAENFLTGIQQKSFTYAINKPIIIITVAGGSGRQRGFSIPCLSDDEGFVRVGKNGKKVCKNARFFGHLNRTFRYKFAFFTECCFSFNEILCSFCDTSYSYVIEKKKLT
jgi:hypothetical protein